MIEHNCAVEKRDKERRRQWLKAKGGSALAGCYLNVRVVR